MTVAEIHTRIETLAEEKNLSMYELARRSGMAESTLYNLFERGTMPKLDTLERICKGLEITLSDFFIFLEDPKDGKHITGEEAALLEISRSLTKRNREHLMVYAVGMRDSQLSKKEDRLRTQKTK